LEELLDRRRLLAVHSICGLDGAKDVINRGERLAHQLRLHPLGLRGEKKVVNIDVGVGRGSDLAS
jgi:hypothetical protein